MSETFDFAHGDPRSRLIGELRRRVGQWEVSGRGEEAAFSSGIAALDQLLPGGALRYGMLVEWLSGLARNGAATLSLLAAREACWPGGVLVVVDRQQTFYPRAAAAWGVDLDRLLIIHPQSARDELWAAVQSLRSPAVAAVWATTGRLDSRAFRRLQLAAEAGHTLGLLLRPAHVRNQPSWANVRLEVEGSRVKSRGSRAGVLALDSRLSTLDLIRRVQVRVLRSRGGRAGNWTTLEIDDATYTVKEVSSNHDAHPLPVVAELADPAAAARSARA